MIGETDGVGWMRRATAILLEHGLPSFPGPQGLGFDREWHWHASPDVAAELRSLHFAGQAAPTIREELFGYRVDVAKVYPPGTLEIVREELGEVLESTRDNHAVVVNAGGDDA